MARQRSAAKTMPFAQGRKATLIAYLSIAIPGLGWLAFGLYPTFATVYYSLTDYSGLPGAPMNWVGFKNYEKAFTVFRPELFASLAATAKYLVAVIVVQNGAALLLALLLHKSRRAFSLYRALIFIPAIFSVVVVGAIWTFLFSPIQGPIQKVLEPLGLENTLSLGNVTWAIWIVALINAWMYTGYTMIIYIAGLNRIPRSVYEAAALDGVTKLRRFRHVTWPLLAPATTVNVFMCAMGCISQFALIIVLTNGGYGTRTIGAYMFSAGFGANSQLGYGSMLLVIQFALTLLIGGGLLAFLRRREVQL